MHVFPGGAGLASLQLDGVHGLDALAAAVRAWATAHPDDPIVYGVQASYQILPRAPDPPPSRPRPARPAARRARLRRPHRLGQHQGAGASRASCTAGRCRPATRSSWAPTASPPASCASPRPTRRCMALLPSGGREKLGITTGRDPVPPPTPERSAPPTAPPSAAAWNGAPRHGITSIHNMDGNPYQLELLARARRRRRAVLPRPPAVPHEERHDARPTCAAIAPAMRARGRPDRLTCDFVKIFVDGVLDSDHRLHARRTMRASPATAACPCSARSRSTPP